MNAAEQLATELESHSDFRVLRRIPPVSTWKVEPSNDVVRAVVIDCETTGLESDDEPIELAVVPFDYSRATGRVAAVHEPFTGLCEPRKAISPESAAIHGITQEMVAGQRITDEQVVAAVGDAKIVIAHNARFDRAMTGKTWPLLDTLCWACSWNDMDWRARGFDSGALSPLLMRMGFFFDGHRALDDAFATLFLLTQQNVLPSLLETARKPLYKIALRGAPYSCKDAIKARGGYQWDDKHPAGKNWWKCVSDPDAELQWARSFCTPDVKKLPASARHSSRVVEL
jgi:DNA polymerase-3 subunit epsilon